MVLRDGVLETMACPLCGEHCTCSSASREDRNSASPSLTYEYEDEAVNERDQHDDAVAGFDDAASELDLPEERIAVPPEDLVLEHAPAPEPDDSLWKQEVASRLESYRSRRGTRRPRFNGTLSLDFDRAVNRMMASALAEEEDRLAVEESAAPANEFFGAAAEPVEDEPTENLEQPVEAPMSPPPRPEPKIIEFPRLPTLFDPVPSGSELAEPVIDKPRILYVPEEVPTSEAPLADIQLAPETPAAPATFELPLHVAPMGQRFFAGALDGFLVLACAAVFMAIVFRQVPAPDSRPTYALAAALPALLWAIYEYLFLVHSAATPGMRMAKIELACFDGGPARRRTRRGRALACMLSVFSLGLGMVWALLDDDTLCWHDRISRTYLVQSSDAEQG